MLKRFRPGARIAVDTWLVTHFISSRIQVAAIISATALFLVAVFVPLGVPVAENLRSTPLQISKRCLLSQDGSNRRPLSTHLYKPSTI